MSAEARSEATEDSYPAILTWRAHDVPRMESVRVQLSGNRIKAYGRIVAAGTRHIRRSVRPTTSSPTIAVPPSACR